MKRQKTVFSSSDQVIHLWANQSQETARCSNVFFNGDTIYSYGTHYVLGRIVTYKGHKVALINDSGYSATTNKHISQAYGAVRHLPRLFSTDLTVETGIREAQSKLIDRVFDTFNGRSFRREYINGKYYADRLKEDVDTFNGLCDLLGFKKYRVDVCPEFIEAINSHVSNQIVQAAIRENKKNSPEEIARRQKEAEKRAEKARIQAAEEIEAWKAGGRLTEAVRKLEPQLIRVSGQLVETSRGAEVPLEDALTLLRAVESGQAKSGQAIGSFTFTSIDGDIVRIGCHALKLSEAKATLEQISR